MSAFHLLFQPVMGWPLFWLACAVAAALAAYLIYLNRRGLLLRLATLGLLLAALATPTLTTDERQPLTDVVAVIVDESASQGLANRRVQSEQALRSLEQSLQQLGNTELRIGRTVTGTTPDTDGTRVFSALSRTVENIPEDRYAGAIIITDGQIHDVPAKLPTALATAPIHGLLTGSASEVDIRMVIDEAPRFAITGKPQLMTFHVEDSRGGNATVVVTLRGPDGSTQQIEVPANTPRQLEVPVQHAGQNIVELEAEAIPGEISTANNRAVAVIKGIRDRLRVLLVSGEPHPGERTWRNLLKSDPAVDLVHFTILRPPEKQDGTLTRELSLIAFPTRELFVDKLSSFDLVVFDRYRIQSILPESYLANVVDYVQNGGAVLIASGPDLIAPDGLSATPLAGIMPASPTGDITQETFRPQLTPLGQRHPVTRDLPGANPTGTPTWGRWFRLIDASTAPDATSLMQGPGDKPLLVLSRAGEGRVAQFLSDQGWLWARGFDGGGPQMELLRRLAHWLMKEPDLEEEALLARQAGESIVIERRTMADSAAPVTVKDPAGRETKVPLSSAGPGQFTNTLPMPQAGLYTLNDGTLSTIVAMGNVDDREMSDVRATAGKLQPVAEATRGGTFWLEKGMPRFVKEKTGRLMAGSGWAALRDNKRFRTTAVTEIPLFATLLSLAALLLVVTGLWYREGR